MNAKQAFFDGLSTAWPDGWDWAPGCPPTCDQARHKDGHGFTCDGHGFSKAPCPVCRNVAGNRYGVGFWPTPAFVDDEHVVRDEPNDVVWLDVCGNCRSDSSEWFVYPRR